MGEGAITSGCEVSRDVYGAGKVHHEVADKAKIVSEIASTDKIEFPDEVNVVDHVPTAHTGVSEVAGQATGPITGCAIGEVASEVTGEVGATDAVASTIEVERQFLHAMTKAGEVKYGTGSHRQPRSQIP
ncbi:MAG: hypothetical protein JOZ09_15835 [Pseudonocardiales bacterium]|nr:hypothetical protein [Pseudonocardiales bacterium]